MKRWTTPLRETARLVKNSASDPSGTLAYESAATPKVMPSFGDHEIIAELGRGGMGVVYKALHIKLKRYVALKMMRAGAFAEREEIDRFLASWGGGALQHPNIVQIHEIDKYEGLPISHWNLWTEAASPHG